MKMFICLGIYSINFHEEYKRNTVIIACYYSVPITPESSRAKWVEAIEQANSSKYNGFGRICNFHFNKEDYEVKGGRFKLSSNAVPSVFENPTQNFSIDSSDCTTPNECRVLKSCTNCEIVEALNERLKMFLQNLQIASKHEKETFDIKLKAALDDNNQKSAQISAMKMKLASQEQTIIRLKKENSKQQSVNIIYLFLNFLAIISIFLSKVNLYFS